MDAALATITKGLDDLAAVDTALLGAVELGVGVLGLQKVIDRARAIQARWLVDADTRRIWAGSGYRDLAGWLAAKAKTSVGSAKKQTGLAKAIGSSPELADAVESGTITPDTAEALQPALAAEHSGNPSDLISACKGSTPAQARAAGSRFQELNPPHGSTPADREHALREKRCLRFSDNGDGTTRVDGALTTLDARIVKDALAAITGKPTAGDERTFEQKQADALVALCAAYARGDVRGGRNRPTILVTINLDDLNGHTNGPGYTSRGDIISAEAVRRMCPNANIARILLDDSMPLDVGRTSRYATDAQYRALIARDGGCRMTDCTMPPDWCEVDHIQEWTEQNGPTDIDLLVLWCIYHHHYRHRPDVRLLGNANNLAIQHPNGTITALPAHGPTHTHRHQTNGNNGNNHTNGNNDDNGNNDNGTLFADTAA